MQIQEHDGQVRASSLQRGGDLRVNALVLPTAMLLLDKARMDEPCPESTVDGWREYLY
jgi:hypothetical protein